MQSNHIRVIIVDDHDLVRQTWSMLLHNKNSIKVIKECSSGTEAINEATASEPHVILMDINMAPVNGFEATKKFLKAAPRLRPQHYAIRRQRLCNQKCFMRGND
jgi:two-component system, NarL family, invasion response regulator UvrY